MGRPAILKIKIVSDATQAGPSFASTSKAADKLSKSTDKASRHMDRLAESSDNVASKGAQAAGGLSGLGDLVGGSFGSAMVVGGVAMQAAADAGDLLNVVTESNIVKKVKDTAVTIAQTAATKAATVATNATALAQRALNAAMRANPIGLAITALTIVAGLFVLAYKKSDTFRAIVQTAGRVAADAVGWVVDKAKSVVSWFGKLGPAATKSKDIALKAFDLYTKPIQVVIDIVKRLIDWIKKIKFPSVPKAISKLGGLVGLGGGEDGPRSPGGSVPRQGRGGPGGSGFSVPVGGTAAGGNVYITVQGALDPVAVAKQIQTLLDRQGLRVGRA